MGKIIRRTYPFEMAVGLLLLIFALSFFLAGQLFSVSSGSLISNEYLGMFLVSAGTIIMVLILWEEFLFPVHIQHHGDETIFRNHRTKLKIQLVFYLTIPAIVAFIYMEYDVDLIRFGIWAVVVLVAPVISKLVSGINNYNDFLNLSPSTISYKNNEKEGAFELSNIQEIKPIRDETKSIIKLQLFFKDNTDVTIDLDEMELEAFYESIEKYLSENYSKLIK